MIKTEYQLSDYINDLDQANIKYHITGNLNDFPVRQVAYDSRKVGDNTLFLCKGNHFKREFLLSAINDGARAYLADKDMDVEIPGIIVEDVRATIPYFARRFHHFPEEHLSVIGITGTKGKSTTSVALYQILVANSQQTSGAPVGIVSSIINHDGKDEIVTGLTTPEPLELFAILEACVDNGVDTVVMEASSQALKYHRVDGIHFTYGAFLNISEDHISAVEHPTFEDYFQSKLQLFDRSSHGFINLDSDYLEDILAHVNKRLPITTFSLKTQADYVANQIHSSQEGTTFTLTYPDGGEHIYSTNLIGDYNVENLTLAISLADQLGVQPQAIQAGIKEVNAPGRMQFYSSLDKEITFVVDFAHNFLSADALFTQVKKAMPKHKQIVVTGSVGSKAVNRRQGLGEAAGRHADFVVLTSDNPDEETVEDINAEIASYLDAYDCPWIQVIDRPQAIRAAYDKAREFLVNGKRSVIFLLGRGLEDDNKINGVIHFMPVDGDVAQMLIDEYEQELRERE